MSANKVQLSGIFSEGYGINPKKLWRMKVGTHHLENGKKVKGIYVKAVISYMLSYTGAGNTCFPSIQTIADDLEISSDIVVNAIGAAVEMNMIDKEEMYPNDKLRRNHKYTLKFLDLGIPCEIRQSRITCSDGTNFVVSTVEPNNNTINNNINNNKKSVYGEASNVKLSDKEYKRLLDKVGSKATLDKCIHKLSSYKLSSGKKYKSDYGAMNTWVIDSILPNGPRKAERNLSEMTEEELRKRMAEGGL